MTLCDHVEIEVDCHDHPWHLPDSDYPECGPGNLPRMEREYGVSIRFLPSHPWNGWAWFYEITGPRLGIVRLLTDEYCGDTEQAAEMVDDATATYDVPDGSRYPEAVA